MVGSGTGSEIIGGHSQSRPEMAKNTNFICKKASEKLRILRRLKKFNIKTFQLFDVYQKEVRSILKYAVPVWNSVITKQQSNQIESKKLLSG